MYSPIKSDMPGTIIKLEKNPGDFVRIGDVLLVLESMKMEVELLSTAAGTLDRFEAAVGEQVNEGDCVAVVRA
jgi:biotin carboxyl carrier protein